MLLTVLSLCFLDPLLRFMNIPEGIYRDARSYISVLFAGMSFTVAYNMFSGIMRALGNSKTPVVILAAANLINIALDLLLIRVLGMGVEGAAIATVFSQLLAALCSGVLIVRDFRSVLPAKAERSMEGRLAGEVFTAGLSMALMTCVVDIGSVVFQGANNALGDVFITAHTAARKWIDIMIGPLSMIAMANSVFTSQNYGAGKYDRIRDGMKKTLLTEIGWGVLICLIVYAGGPFMIRLVTGTNDADVVAYAYTSLRIHFPFFPLLGILFCTRMALQSMGSKFTPVAASGIELLMKLAAGIFIIPAFGFPGTCWIEPVTWTLCAIFLTAVYLKKQGSLPRSAPA